MKYIGTTLVFFLKENDLFKAIQSSYIFELTTLTDLKEKIEDLANQLVQSDYKGYTYIGISDLYVSENEGEANFLGRTSFFMDKKKSDSEKHILNIEELKRTFESIKSYKKLNIGFVYFHQDKEGQEYNSTIIVYSQIITKSNLNSIYKIAESKNFMQKIIDFSVEQLHIDGLKFIGISELYPVRDTGLFSKHGEFKNFNEIESVLIPENELESAFNNVIEDYKYV